MSKDEKSERAAHSPLAKQAVENAARSSYDRLIAALAAWCGDISAAEDALAEAFARALKSWARDGIPDSPQAWLLTASKNVLRDGYKSAASRTATPLEPHHDQATTPAQKGDDMDFSGSSETFPDERLKLLFVCAHPAIDEKIRTPLMLQTVLGLDAVTIAPAFLLKPATLAQQLVRAKRKIKQARIPFLVPDEAQIAERLSYVQEAIYGAYSLDWESATDSDMTRDLSTEAVYLADMLSGLMDQDAECLGLAALVNFSYARRAARESDEFLPLDKQDTDLWDADHLQRAETLLQRASALQSVGRYQLEAAIQSVHCDRRKTGKTDWQSIAHLYQGILSVAPTWGAAIAHAAAIGASQGPHAGLDALARLNEVAIADFQPAWATRAHLLRECGNAEAALTAYDKAISLTKKPRQKAWLQRQRELCLS